MKNSKAGRIMLKFPLSIMMSAVVLGMMTTSIDAQAATHTVQTGEYLISIATQYGVTVNQLREWNNLTDDTVQVNDVLIVEAAEVEDLTEAEVVTTETELVETSEPSETPIETPESDQQTEPVEAPVEEPTEAPAEAPESIEAPELVEEPVLALQATEPDYSTGTVIIHLVKPGEYLHLIARNYGVTANELRLWNHLTSDVLSVGQELKIIPGTVGEPQVPLPPPAPGATYLVKAGDTLWSVAQRYGLTVNQLQTWNNLTTNVLSVGQTLRMTAPTTTPPPPATGTSYTVKAGDNLWSIGQRFGVTVSQLQTWNNLSTNFLSVGQVLRLTAPTTPPPPATGTSYTVKAGDSLWSIGQRFGVTVSQLQTWNNLTTNFLSVGQVLRLTASTTTPPPATGTSYTVKAGDSLWSIGQRFGVTVSQLQTWNNLTTNFLSVGQVLRLTATTTPPPPATGTTYTVKAGDSLWSIGQRYGVTVNQLRTWNNLTTNVLSVGQRLKVVGEATPTPPPTTAYTVKAGDTLWSISTRYGISVAQVKQWNNLTSNFLSVGQRLNVTSPSTTYTVKSGDSLWKIATQFGVTIQNLKDWNGLTSNVIYTNQRLIVK